MMRKLRIYTLILYTKYENKVPKYYKVFNFFLTTKAFVLPSDRNTKVRIIKVLLYLQNKLLYRVCIVLTLQCFMM